MIIEDTNPFAAEMRASLNISKDDELEFFHDDSTLELREEAVEFFTGLKSTAQQNHQNLDSTFFESLKIETNHDIELLDIGSYSEFVFGLDNDNEDALDAFEKEFNLNLKLDDRESIFEKNPLATDKEISSFFLRMNQVNQFVYKKIIKEGFGDIIDVEKYKIIYEYSLFFERELNAFDSTKLTGRCGTVDVNNDLVTLPGIIYALSSMKYHEESVFFLTYEVMYGELGVLNRIPPKSDIIARIKIKKLFDEDGNEVKFTLSNFDKAIKKTEKAYMSARQLFRNGVHDGAIKIYRREIDFLERTHLANDAEEEKVNHYLKNMYEEMAMCYNKIGNPQKTCIAIRELEKLVSIKNNARALYAKGYALMKLDHYKDALRLFYVAHKLNPKSRKLINAIKELEKLMADVKSFQTTKQALEQNLNTDVSNCDIEASSMSKKYLNLPQN